MKILLAVDSSECSREAIDELGARPWPKGSEVLVLCVALAAPYIEEPLLLGGAAFAQLLDTELRAATLIARRAARRLAARTRGLTIHHRAFVGVPSTGIIEESRRWGADLIVLGSHGRGAAARLFLGSVSNAVALHAPCSVEIVRRASRRPSRSKAPSSRSGARKAS